MPPHLRESPSPQVRPRGLVSPNIRLCSAASFNFGIVLAQGSRRSSWPRPQSRTRSQKCLCILSSVWRKEGGRSETGAGGSRIHAMQRVCSRGCGGSLIWNSNPAFRPAGRSWNLLAGPIRPRQGTYPSRDAFRPPHGSQPGQALVQIAAGLRVKRCRRRPGTSICPNEGAGSRQHRTAAWLMRGRYIPSSCMGTLRI
jgi:hypothetical protein